MTLVYLVQHGDKEALPGDPGLTPAGEQRAARTGQWLRQAGLRSLYASPLRRAQQTAALIAAGTGLPVRTDARLRERMNWDGSRPLEDFLAEWACATAHRDFVTSDGESSRQAGTGCAGSWPDCPPGSPRSPPSPTAASPPTCCATCCPTRRCRPAWPTLASRPAPSLPSTASPSSQSPQPATCPSPRPPRPHRHDRPAAAPISRIRAPELRSAQDPDSTPNGYTRVTG